MTTRVLVADDRAPFRLAARRVLRAAAGFELVGEVTSGEQAVALAAALGPDVVLMDILMPGIGGIEAARRIATARPAIVTILLSTYRAQDLPVEAQSCGAAAYVHKSDFGAGVLQELYASRSAR
jgi:two-component system invasion response regulator UvrY